MTAAPKKTQHTPTKWNDPKWLAKELTRAELASSKRSEARSAMPPGSSRARVTSANAAWARAAEYRDLVRSRLDALQSAMSNRVDISRMNVESERTTRTTVRMVAIDVEGDDETVGSALRCVAAILDGSAS